MFVLRGSRINAASTDDANAAAAVDAAKPPAARLRLRLSRDPAPADESKRSDIVGVSTSSVAPVVEGQPSGPEGDRHIIEGSSDHTTHSATNVVATGTDAPDAPHNHRMIITVTFGEEDDNPTSAPRRKKEKREGLVMAKKTNTHTATNSVTVSTVSGTLVDSSTTAKKRRGVKRRSSEGIIDAPPAPSGEDARRPQPSSESVVPYQPSSEAVVPSQSVQVKKEINHTKAAELAPGETPSKSNGVPTSEPPVVKANVSNEKPAALKAANEPVALKASNEPTVVKASNEPVVVKAPNEPVVVKAPNEPVVVKAPNEPVVVKAPNEPAVVKAPNEPAGVSVQPTIFTRAELRRLKEEEDSARAKSKRVRAAAPVKVKDEPGERPLPPTRAELVGRVLERMEHGKPFSTEGKPFSAASTLAVETRQVGFPQGFFSFREPPWMWPVDMRQAEDHPFFLPWLDDDLADRECTLTDISRSMAAVLRSPGAPGYGSWG